MSSLGIGAIGLASLYLVTTIVFQFPPFSRRFGMLDRLGLLPRWQFFARGTIGADLRVQLRDRDADGAVSDWCDLPPIERRRALDCLWRPLQFRTGTLLLAIEMLDRRVAAGRSADNDISLAYAAILSECRRAERVPGVAARQFALTGGADGARDERCIRYMSDFHIF